MTTFDVNNPNDLTDLVGPVHTDGQRLPGGAWARELRMNMSGCNDAFISDANAIAKFIGELVKEIGMKPYGPPAIHTFGEGALYGNTVIQLIETSNITSRVVPVVPVPPGDITVHANHEVPEKTVFFNLMSCADFPRTQTINRIVQAFDADDYVVMPGELRVAPRVGRR